MRSLRVWFLPVSVLILVAAALSVPLPVFLEQPADPLSLADAVTVGGPDATEVEGDYLLTAISLSRATPFDLVATIGADDVSRTAVADVVPLEVLPGEFFDQQREVFASSADLAAAVGLNAAGFPIDLRGDGALVTQVLPGLPADGVVLPGDVVVMAAGAPVTTPAELGAAVRATGADEAIALTLLRDGEPIEVSLVPVPVEDADAPLIGVASQTLHARVELPVPVEVDSGRIGGPSAGLMIALTVYDKVLPEVDLAAGRRIAGTGTLDEQGMVGRVGGVGLKALAAAREGAQLFLAPASQTAEARAGVPQGSAMRVVGVATFDAAVAALGGPA